MEERIKSVWPSAFGACRFGKAEHSDQVPYTVFILVSAVESDKDDGYTFRYQADIYLNKVDTEIIRENINGIAHEDFAVTIDNIQWQYSEALKKYVHMVDLIIYTKWPLT